ncbi:MAG: FAD-dependent oxidoreductase [Sphingomonas sp.]|nr:MAG: FAD-dependent oxidoreductase [Sphingomonas sp.]
MSATLYPDTPAPGACVEAGRGPPSYYAATSNPAPTASPLGQEAKVDVCIVGGGFTGLSAALRLAERGLSVVLLEGGALGDGASGRNGGQVHVGMRRDQQWLERAVGPDDARHLWALALDARADLDRLIAEHGIACDFRPGHLHGDHRQRFVADTHRDVDHLRDHYGYQDIRFVDRDEIAELVPGAGYFGGSLDRRGGHLHPLNLALGIAGAAIARGAALHPHSPATAIRQRAGRWCVETKRGSVTADHVLLACGGYMRGLQPVVEKHVMPINNYIAVTAPLGEAHAAAIIRQGLAVSDSRFVVYYYRMTPDHRLLFGGGENYSYRFPDDIAGFVRPHMGRVFPALADAPIDHAWGGTLSVTTSRMPFVRQLKPGLYNASGFSGLGVVLAPYFGRIMADAIAGERADFDRLTRLPGTAFPGGRLLRYPTLIAVMSMFALRDRL